MTAVILVAWRGVTQQAGYAETAIAAFGVLTVFALAWIAVMTTLRRRSRRWRRSR